MRCQIAEIEAADIRQRYAGKRAPRANRTKLSGAWVVDNMEVVRLQKEEEAKEEQKLKKGQEKAARAQAKVTGQSTVQGRQGGRPPLAKVQSENQITDYHSLTTQLQSVTIIISDAEGEREESEHDLGDTDWDCVDSHETPRHQMGLRTRRVGRGGYKEVVPDVEDCD